MKIYFVTTGLREEIEVIKKVRPPRLLCSFWYFKNKPLGAFCEEIGYKPEILLDSGAYSAYTKGKNVNLLDYLDYIRANHEFISEYIALDVIGKFGLTVNVFRFMYRAGLNPIPVIHYGMHPVMWSYYGLFPIHSIALGNTVGVQDKRKVARWCESVKKRFPDLDLHLLGSSSGAILESGVLDSCDSSTWYMMAVNGEPKEIPGRSREAKMARAEANMRKIMEDFDEKPVPIDDHHGEPDDGQI